MMKSWPLTESQLGMFLAWNEDHDSTQYAVPVAFRLPRTVDLDKLEKAIRTVAEAYPAYRTRFVEEDGEIRQVSDPAVKIPIVRRKVSVAEAESALAAYPHPYDYFKGPLFRAEILETPEDARLILDWAHVIVDGTAGTAFFNAVASLYNGADGSPVGTEQVDIFAYAEAEKKSFESADYREAAEAAKARFGGRAMTVPEEGMRDEGSGINAGKAYLDESAWVSRTEIDAWCRENGVHPNLFFMGVFARVLGLYANEKDVVFWTVNHGRKDPALKATQGLLVKTVPVLGELKGEATLADYFKSFKLHRAGVYPFTHFCRDLGIKPGWGFVYQEGTTNYRIELGSAVVEGWLLSGGGAGEMPVLQVFGGRERFQLQMTALPGRYDEAFLRGFAERCATVAENFAAGGERVADVSVLADGERDEVLKLSKGEELEFDREKTFVDLFREQANARSEATAVVDCEGSISYRELDERSDALAAELVKLGVKPGGFVGLMLPRRVVFPVAMIAVQKCGAGYVPMDPEYPADRLAYMLANSEAPVLVTVRSLLADKQLDFKGQVLFFEDEVPGAESQVPGAGCLVPGAESQVPGAGCLVPGAESQVPGAECLVPGAESQVPGAGCLVPGAESQVLGAECLVPGAESQVPGAECLVPGAGQLITSHQPPSTNHQPPSTRHQAPSTNQATPDSPAYMIYTSGSTGRPKGVVLPNRALRAMIAWFVRDCGLGPGKKNLSITSFSFDASVPDLFPPLAAGGELHILTEEQRKDLEGVHDYAVKVGATGLTTSTQLGLALVNTYPDLPLEYMMLGGEKMVPFAKTPVRMLNGYGPTEFAVCSSYHEVDQSKAYDIPIGRAVPNSYSLIVDKLGQLVPAGMTGELALAGEQIAEGYWKLPEKTDSVFVPCALCLVPGAERQVPGAECLVPGADGSLAPSTKHQTPSTKHQAPSTMYRTGDLARYDANGELEFLGRIDFQVKLRGFRIEIGEIEHAAASFPGIGAVAAEVKEVAGAKHLVLYYSLRESEQSDNRTIEQSEQSQFQSSLRMHLAKILTAYMVPDFYVAMDSLPLTPNGKIDRRKLPVPEADDEPIIAPETESEKKIFEVVASVLKTEAFGVTHDFNRLGLTSLGAMSLLAKLKKQCNLSVSMKTLTANPTVRQLAALAGAQGPAAGTPPQRKRPRRATYPMTENQRGIYADWMRNPDALQYNIPAAFRFTGVAAAKLASATEKVIAAHPALMARFVEKDGEFVQARRDDFTIAVPVEKLDFEPDEKFLGEALRPFAPDAEVLTRGTVYETPSAAVLLLDIHHTVFDGYSVGVFLSELKRVLAGGEPAGEGYTAFDAALDERDYLESETLEEDDKWFARYLDGAESTAVATSSEGADGKPGEAGRVSVRIPARAIGARARELGVTASDWFLTAFTELLRRVGREEDVLVNFVTAGRSDPEVQETVGMFVKTLPLRGIRDAKTFPEAVRRMHGSVQELIGRERESYVRLSEKLGVRPEILFAFEGGIFDLPEGCELLSPETGTVKTPLAVLVTPGNDDFELKFEYDRSMYSEKDMGLLLGMFAQLAQNACGDRNVAAAPLTDIPLLSEEDAEKVLALSTGEAIEYDATKTVVNLIHANAIARPFATAVVDCEGSITYGELDARSDALAAELAKLGVKPGGFVGLMLSRRLSFVVSFLAVQKCGAGYVPMDADYPADRLAYMLENSEAPVLVTVRELFADKQLDFKGKVIFFEEKVPGAESQVLGAESQVPGAGCLVPGAESQVLGAESQVLGAGCLVSGAGQLITSHQPPSTNHQPPTTNHQSPTTNLATPDSPAYMIYTSGSTGRPKGVVVPHRALRHMVAWTTETLGLRPGFKVVSHPSFSFDASVIDLFPALCAGGELHIYGEEIRKDLPGMRDYIVKNGIEGGTMSTQIGMTLLDTYPDLPLKYMIVGGEKLMPIAKTNVKIVNGYGPTEFTVCSSAQIVDQSKEGDIPIGRAVPGTMSLIVDRYGQLLPQGFAGELALAGPQIAEGYWRLPEKTASVFVPSPALQSNNPNNRTIRTIEQFSRMYRTGDLARYNPEGTLDYMGRLDFQVKLRGFRIEIGEIEHKAASFPGVGAVAAEVRDVAGAKHLVLYYSLQKVEQSNNRTIEQSEQSEFQSSLRAHLAKTLTDYMVPDYFVRMDPMPMTPNGKINRKLLPSPEGAATEAEYVEPANETEKKIAAAYAEILKLDKFGATTDFFASGGTSLIGIKAVVALQKQGLDVQYGDLFKYKTPRTLAAFLSGEPVPVSSQSNNPNNRTSERFDYGAYDYEAIDKLLMATPTELFEGFRRHSLGDVLLTGATGYLGVHVLRRLLESTDATVYALVRPKKGVGAEKRLDSQFVYYFGEKVPRRFKERLAFVEGDITDKFEAKGKGEGEQRQCLRLPSVNTVINCAALVKHYVADDLMDRINVGGVENLVAWCEKSGARLVHVSTYSVGGMIRTDSAAVLDERHLYIGQESDNDYVRTKFLAERAVLAAIAAGKIRGKIMRLGNLMGREADGEFQMNVGANAFVNSLKSYKALGAYPLENLASKIEMSPIDRVAEAICLLATTPDEMCVFHPYNCYPLDMGAVMGAMNRHGFNVDWVSRAAFAATVDALRNDPSRASELQGILHYTGHLLKGLRIAPAPNDWTTTVLYRLGFRWRPADDDYLSSFLRMLDELAVFG